MAQLWETFRVGSGNPSGATLDAHLCSDFITAHGSCGDLGAARSVLDEARRLDVEAASPQSPHAGEGSLSASLANTRVYNAFLRACIKGGALGEAEAALSDMAADGVASDAFTCSLGVQVYSRTGRLATAARLLEEAGSVADTFSHNVSLLHLPCTTPVPSMYYLTPVADTFSHNGLAGGRFD